LKKKRLSLEKFSIFLDKGAEMKLAMIFWQIVKKANVFPVLLSLVLITTAAGAKTLIHTPNEKSAASPNVLVEPSATFERIWVDYNIMEGGVNGMRIHAKFKVYDMKNVPGYMAVYFQERDGTPLDDNNGKFDSDDGTVAAYREIAPGYAVTAYEDLQLFMPYAELDLSDGDYNLRMDVDVIYKEGGLVSHLTFYDFTYNSGKKKPVVTFDRVWIDYDITRNGLRGMLIHTKFTVVGMKGTAGYVAIYFSKKNGDKLFTSNRAYRSKEGQVAVYFDMTPAYERTVYDDAQVFLPYAELNLTKGKYDLQMDVDLIYENGDLIQHLTYHDFWYEK
jgi:hypothetical protein